MTIRLSHFDAAEYLDSSEEIAAFLEDALESGDAAVFAGALGVAARARGMSQLAQETGLSRQTLYRSLSPGGNPEMSTVLKVLSAMGVALAPKARTTAAFLEDRGVEKASDS